MFYKRFQSRCYDVVHPPEIALLLKRLYRVLLRMIYIRTFSYCYFGLAKWEKRWQMQFHPDKCQVLRITNKRNPIIFNYTLHDHILATVTQAKYLGVTITNDLNWKQHVENISKSANKALGFLRRNLRINSVKAKEQA